MSDNILAKRFKVRRLELKMSQVQVAEGICKQARISRIEKGDYSPGAELLYKLAKKMYVSVEYFFDEGVEEESFENLGKFKELSRKLLDQRDYESLKYIYEMEVEKEQALSTSDKLYLEWIGCIVAFYVEKKHGEATDKLEKLIVEVKGDNKLYLTFSNTLVGFYSDINNEKVLEKYNELFEIIEKIKTNDVDLIKKILRIRYNFCYNLYKNSLYQEMIIETKKTMDLCSQYGVLYMLGDLYTLLGDGYEEFKEFSEAKKCYEKAVIFYEAEKCEKLVKKVKDYLEENYS